MPLYLSWNDCINTSVKEDSLVLEYLQHIVEIVTKVDPLVFSVIVGMDKCKMLLNFILIQDLNHSITSEDLLLDLNVGRVVLQGRLKSISVVLTLIHLNWVRRVYQQYSRLTP